MSFDRWFNAERHDVKTFNNIFNLSRINSNPDDEVEIGAISTGEIREIRVGGKTLYMTLNYENLKRKWKQEILESDKQEVDESIFNDLTNMEKALIGYLYEKKILITLKHALEYFNLSHIDRTIKTLKDKDIIERTSAGEGNSAVWQLKINIQNPEPFLKAMEEKREAGEMASKEIQNPTKVSDAYKLTPAEFKIYTFMKEHKLVSNRSIIVDLAFISAKSVQNSLKKLEKLGYIRTFSYGSGCGVAIQFIGE